MRRTRTARVAAATYDAHGWEEREGMSFDSHLRRESKSKTLYTVRISLASCRRSKYSNPNPKCFQHPQTRWQSLPGRNRYAFVWQNAMSSRTRSHRSLNNVCIFPPLPYSPLTPADRRLAQQTKLLKERNASLLKAVGSVRANPSSSTVYIPGTASGEECVIPSLTPLTHLHPCPCRNPVRAAYMASLESQISSLRDELASVYKTQGQNAQRLLAMNETLREKEELSRIESENLRKAREEIDRLRRKVDQHNELMMEKDRTAQVSNL